VDVKDKEDGTTADGKIDAANLYIRAEYMEGSDKAAVPQQGHQIITGAIAGKNIMEASDCKTCHKPDEKSIGPSFKDVAGKYKDDPNAADYLANKIINGGGGVWGETAMSAHPTLSQSEAHQLVEYIMSVGGNNKQAPSLPVTGTIDPTTGKPEKDNGLLYLIATYTDKGGPGIKPITGSDAVALRSPKIAAAAFDKSDAVSSFEFNGQKLLIPTASGWAAYNSLDFTAVTGINVIYFTQEPLKYGYVVELFLDKAEGVKLGEATIGVGAKAMAPNSANVSFAPITDGKKHTLYVRIKTADPAEKGNLGITTFQLLSK
jgi:cytochrome c551/c552